MVESANLLHLKSNYPSIRIFQKHREYSQEENHTFHPTVVFVSCSLLVEVSNLENVGRAIIPVVFVCLFVCLFV
jgi:NAD-dependent oxidoreductase involved in siderophore biosynthesis